jgi:uncharacterized damage-inducible protein DinB
MKQAAAALALVLTCTAHPASAGPMTAGERQRLVAHFEMTEAWLDDEVKNLSPGQMKFKMTPESWSIEEVVMHLAIAEPQYWDQFKQSLARPVQPDFTTTGEARVPREQHADLKTAHASFKKLRAEMLTLAKDTQEDLRGRQFLTASQDLYQWYLMISTHSMRHILQIREVKAHKNFPRR